jgi:hypothetical protein
MRICVTRWAMCGMLAAACAGGNMRLATAKNHFLAIGGGYDASGNPASLERDLRFASATIAATMISTNVATPAGAANGAPEPAVEIFFADGDDPARDVQYVDAAAAKACPPLVRVLAELFGTPDAVAFRYRDHTLDGVLGPTDYEVMEQRFQELGRELASGDRLFVIAAGHGGEAYDRAAESDEEPREVERGATEEPADRENDEETEDDGAESNGEDASINPYDTSLLLWNQDELLASELCRWLDELPRDIEVVLVMGQCYSGGFANVIFNGADARLGLSPAPRCGFFSQLYDRPAAGCAADLDDEDVHEYSSYFWAALGGKTRDGVTVTADFDKSGGVSLAEAHAFAVIESDTLDVPVRTSEALLRAYSRLGGPFELQEGPTAGTAAGVREKEADAADAPMRRDDASTELREPGGSLAELAALARPDQRAILDNLPAKIGGMPLKTVEDVRVELGTALEQIDDANEALDAAMTATDEALIVAQNEAYAAWPELHFRESTAAAELLAAQGEKIAARVEAMGSYVTLLAAREQEKKLTAEADAAEAAAAQLERLLRTIEDVVLAENLKIVASPEIFARYEELVRMEERGLK